MKFVYIYSHETKGAFTLEDFYGKIVAYRGKGENLISIQLFHFYFIFLPH